MPRRLPGRAIQAGTITVTQLETSVANTVQTGGGPKITNVEVTSNSYVVLDDTAVDIAGGYIKITGTGFAAGCQVLINNTPATSTTFIGPTEVRAQLPASSAGTYMLYVINADGGVAIRVNGVTFSATPSWVTASDLTSYALGDAISIQLSATGASTFALAAGSTLPTGLTLSAGGLLSGSVTGLENDTSYSFTITATDAENQDSPRTFSITITVQLQVSRSLRFNAADTTSLSWIPSNTGNLQTFTISCWIKRSAITGTGNPILVAGTDANDYFYINLTNTDTLSIVTGEAGTANANNVATSAVFRDTGSWYHMVINIDFSNATSTDRIRAYVNGTRQTLTGTFAAASFTGTRHNRAGITHYIGRWMNGSPYFSGYITEFYFIDGQALTPAAFAETNTTTGQYIPKKYTGTYGTNGFYLPFTDNSSVANLGRNYQPLTADPFWDRTVLLLNGTGTNNANNNTFTDSSVNAFAITRNGNVSQGRFSPFTQGGWSNYFNGSNAYLQVASNAAFTLGSSEDFTVECWIYPTANFVASGAPNYIVTSHSSYDNGYTNRWGLAGISTSVIGWYDSLGGFGTQTTSLSLLNKWTHVAAVRSNSTIKIYIDGIQNGTPQTTNQAYTTNSLVNIGFASGGNYFSGYISNVRVVKGTAVYTSNFTPPTALLTAITNTSLLTCHANRFLDSSTNNFAITRNGDARVVALSPFTPTTAYSAVTNGGSAYFDGTGDYLQTTISALPGQFTVEFWFYRLTTGNNFMFNIGDSINNTGAEVYIGTNGTVLNYYSNGNARITATPPNAGTWSYIAVSRDASNVVRLYVDGTQVGGTYTQAATLDTTLRVGAEYYNAAITGTATGYISGFRVSNTARTITVPTQPMVNDANTVCLLNFTNAAIVDATGDNNIETVGDAKISTAQSKWGSGSLSFNGTTDYLQGPRNTIIDLGSGDFTIELWAYITSTTAKAIINLTNKTAYPGLILKGNDTNLQLLAASGDASWAVNLNVTGLSSVLNTWVHIAGVRSGNVFTLYRNGTSVGTTTVSMTVESNLQPVIGVAIDSVGISDYFSGYMQDVRITRAARYTGTFTPPTAQFAYNQGDINYNQWVPTNFSVTAGAGNDSLLDVPTNWGVDTGLGGEVRGNYCTWNPLNATSASTANGNLETTLSGNAGLSGQIRGSMANLSGKWYWESVVTADGNQSHWIGVIGASSRYDIRLDNSNTLNQVLYARYDGQKIVNGTISAYGASYIVGDVIGIALDLDIGIVTFYKNNVSQGAISLPTTGIAYTPVFWYSTTATSGTIASNFGQRPFAYAAPSGFKSLNTHNLPALAVAKSNTAFDTVLYTGTGSTQTIGGLNFAPDLVWIKDRSSSVVGHRLYDTIRGATKEIYTHSTSAETTDAAGLTAFTANGFTTGNSAGTNTNGDNLVAWAWDAGTTTVVNTAGSITANVRVNTSAGISIVSYAGSQASTFTIGHGLLSAPSFIITKSRNAVGDWGVYYTNEGVNTNWLLLNSTASKGTQNGTLAGGAYLISNAQTLQIGSSAYANGSSQMIAYCFAAVPGFSAFGTYTGNGSTDGPFVYLGFRPKFLLTKRADSTSNWLISDAVRNSENPVTRELFPNAPDSEPSPNSAYAFDFLSNGVKLRRATDSSLNISGGTYIYAAFAESPFKYARAR